MNLISKENNLYELKAEHLEDLWTLSEIISPESIVYSSTKRKVALGNDKTKQITKIIFVELKVQKTSFENDILRISGEIQNETEFTAVGQAHTLSFNVNDTIKFKKDKFLKYEQNMLDKSIESKQTQNLLILLDKDEMIVSSFNEYNFKVLANEKNLGSKKGYANISINEEEEKFKIIESLFSKDYNSIVLMGPGNSREKFKKFLSTKNIKTLSLAFSQVGSNFVEKAIAKVQESNLIGENQIAREQKEIDLLLVAIEKNQNEKFD